MLEKLVAILKPQIPSIVNRALTAAAALLAAHGLLPQSADAQFVQIGSAIAIAVLSEAWAWYRNHRNDTAITTMSNNIAADIPGATAKDVVAVASKGIAPVAATLTCIMGLFLVISLGGCLSPSQAQTADTVAADVTAVAAAVAPATLAKVDASCPAVLDGFKATIAALKKANVGASALEIVQQNFTLAKAACNNKKQLVANDTKPVTPVNSGNSYAWLIGLLPDALKIAGIVLPLVL